MSSSQNGSIRQGGDSTDTEASEQTQHAAVAFALAQPAILENILKFLVLTEKGSRSIDNIRSLRLVQKNWLSAVSKVLESHRKPLYKLTLTADNSLKESAKVKAEGKLLDRFVKFYTDKQITPFPTFRLNIEEEFFQLESYKSFSKCLRKCGSGLLTLLMKVPEFGGSLPGKLPKIALPNLKKLDFVVTQSLFEDLDEEDVSEEMIENVFHLMQSFLTKAESLSSLYIVTLDGHTPYLVECIDLPSSLTNLYLKIDMEYNQLEMLARNDLPNLTCLTLKTEDFIDGNLLNKLLENLCKTLETLGIIPGNGNPARVPCLVKFPVMEQLNHLMLYHPMIELTEDVSALSASFPKMKKLMLTNQTSAMLKKWTTNGPLPLVEVLHLQQIEENKKRSVGAQLPLGLDLMKGVCQTFKNVKELNLATCSKDVAALQYVFKEMSQLTVLSLHFTEGLIHDSVQDKMDAMFLGVPVKFVKKWRATPLLWKEFGDNDEKAPSIRLLSELKSLRLECDQMYFKLKPMISWLTFLTLSRKMPKLLKLELGPGFWVNEQQTQEWTSKGGQVRNLGM